VVIGDTPADVRCARAIGARAVAVATGVYSCEQLQPSDPDHLFATLESTDDVLGKLLTRLS
ncbi:MAG: HAD family hydrolase, partial [Planctomycetaceae bacterium]